MLSMNLLFIYLFIGYGGVWIMKELVSLTLLAYRFKGRNKIRISLRKLIPTVRCVPLHSLLFSCSYLVEASIETYRGQYNLPSKRFTNDRVIRSYGACVTSSNCEEITRIPAETNVWCNLRMEADSRGNRGGSSRIVGTGGLEERNGKWMEDSSSIWICSSR